MLNIVTPCSRPENLAFIEKSINIPLKDYRWIIVFDMASIPNTYIPHNAETYCYQQEGSIVGHAQRNFALNLIQEGHIYFNDDDTLLHPELWKNIEDILEYHDFISFDQANKNLSLRLIGSNIKVDYIDSHNFIVSKSLCKNIQFYINRYNADGYFATDCYANASSPIYINKVLSIYNQLR
jgi:hypothetical protein